MIQNHVEPRNAELVIHRVFDAPRDLVFKAWTEAERLAQWWGPKGFALGVAKLDLRPGGTFHFSMKAPDGTVMWARFTYREIHAPHRIVFVNSFSDEKGGLVRSAHSPSWPLEMLNVVTMTEKDGRTTVTLRVSALGGTDLEKKTFAEGLESMQGGFGGTFDQLVDYLGTTDRELIVTRLIDAPRELVFDAFTDPEHIAKWWGPNGYTNTTQAIDLRAGGSWRFVMHGPDGTSYPTTIVYREISRPDRLITAHSGHGSDEVLFETTVTFVEQAGKTRLTMRLLMSNAAAAAEARKFGAVELGQETLAKLEAHLERPS